MGQLTQTTAQVQVILDDADAANVGKTSLTDGSDTTSVAFKKSGFYSLQGSSANAPSTDRAVLISAVRDTAATGEIRYGQIAITESNGLWWNRDDGGSLGTWYEAVTTASAQTLTNKTLTSPILTTPKINDSAADHQYIFAGSDLAADRTVTLPLLTGDDTFVFAAHTQTLTNKTLTIPTVSGLTLSDASIIFEGATANDYETTLTVTDPTADRTITLPDATDTLVGRATTDTLTNKTLTSPIASGLTLSDASIVFEGATADAHETTLTVTDPTADRIITLPNATDTLVGLATTDTLTNKTLTSPVFNTGVSGTAVLDEDDFTGASATTLASSESIKAYVDSQVGSFDTLSEVLAAGNTTGATNIEVENAQKVQFRDAAIYVNSSADGQLDIVADTTVQIDSGGTITLDAETDGQVAFKDGGTQYGLISKAVDNLILKSSVVDGDVIIQGTDSGGTVTAATFDMSNSGAATFGGAVTADAGISVDNINIDGTTIALSSGDLTLDVAGDINLDADGGDIRFKDGGTEFYKVAKNGDHVQLFSTIQNGDLTFNGFDDSSHIVALTLDMSEAGAATFNAGAFFDGSVGIGTASPAIGGGRTYALALTIDGGVSGSLEDTGGLEIGGSTSVNDRLVGSISYFNRDNSGAGATTRQQVAIIEARSVTSDSNAGDDSGGNLTFGTKSEGGSIAERMRITSAGNIGIGTTSPASPTGFGSSGILHLKAATGNDCSIVLEGLSGSGGRQEIGASGGALQFYRGAATGSMTESMRIDSAGNLNVARSAYTSASTNGFHANADGWTHTSVNNEPVAYFNRNTSDGDVVKILQAGSTVGSIGSSNGGERLYMVNDSTGLSFLGDFSKILPCDSAGSPRDAAIDLGQASGGRFKDLHLSGGISLVTASGSTSSTLINAISGVTNGFQIQSNSSNQMTYDFNTGLGLGMRLTDDFNLLVGNTDITNSRLGVRGTVLAATLETTSTNTGHEVLVLKKPNATGRSVAFIQGSSDVGNISVTSSATTYNTSSDQRLKENIVDAPSASSDIDAIQVRSFDWKADGSHQKYGMVAQELQTVAPEAVSAPEDPEEMMGVDYSKLVPMLVKEIQSLRARVAQLES